MTKATHDEIHITVVIRLPDDNPPGAKPGQTILDAWRTFSEAIKTTGEVVANEFHLRQGRPGRREGFKINRR